MHYHPAKAAYIIYACVVLHNIAVKARLELREEELEVDEVVNEDHNNANVNGMKMQLFNDVIDFL